MGTIFHNKFLRVSGDGNFKGHSSKPYNTPFLYSVLGEGDVIYKRVGRAVNKPKVEKRPVPFVVGRVYTADDGVKWTFLGHLGDKAVWQALHKTWAYLTNKNGTALLGAHRSFPQPVGEVVVGNELVIEEE